ncbi:MAG: AI-2E family transporter [Pseudonocardiaceae bacterium]|nr:AI-2E family transporter [Pseudonocardiaceae bacterium]
MRKSVPKGLRVSAAWSWRLLVVGAALYGLLWLLGYFSVVVIPVAIALLLAALMAPAVGQLSRRRVPRGLATAVVLVGGLAVLGAVLTFVIAEFTRGLPALQEQIGQSLDQIRDWLVEGPVGLRQEQITEALDNAVSTLQENQAEITSGALNTAAGIGEGITAFLLVLFILIFFLSGGEAIWTFVVRGVPAHVRGRVDLAGRRGFASLVQYVRATAAVAVVDAIGIGIGLWAVGVPLVIPLATFTFLAAFVPIIGAIVAGAVAVLVALVSNGFVAALVVLAIVIGVQQLESNVLQPLLLGRAVNLHPLAVVLAITVGLVAAGIAGALLSVPLLAVVNAGVRSLLHDEVSENATSQEADPLSPSEARPAGSGEQGDGEPNGGEQPDDAESR